MADSAQKPTSVQIITIAAEQAGQRIDNFLLTLQKGVPKSRIYRAIRKGEVRVNKGRIKQTYKLQAGDVVRIPPLRGSDKSPSAHVSDTLAQILREQVLYEDDFLIALNKPEGLAVHAGSQIHTGVIEALKIMRPEAAYLELVHRLDRDTSGCLLIAKRRDALLHMQDQMRGSTIDKRYLTLTLGHWPKDDNLVIKSLQKNTVIEGENMVVVDPAGKKAKSQFVVREQFRHAQLMEVRLFTGRTHQIRVHAASSGHPVAGDEKYGDRQFNKTLKQQGLQRMFLHAWRLQLQHPGNAQPISFEAPLPDSLTRVLNTLSDNTDN